MSGLLSAYLLVDQYLAESILLIARFFALFTMMSLHREVLLALIG